MKKGLKLPFRNAGELQDIRRHHSGQAAATGAVNRSRARQEAGRRRPRAQLPSGDAAGRLAGRDKVVSMEGG
ncbi:hypothetical protein [Allgaiera indica]|uniref:Uncharacterized protein n=1 Tax=Allgaiera indica TaxID=765699 RepID=A0A1H2YLA9_9RHOB|nr:hypothetical protein [Allgaiera indica]SDX05771.1 hypothetical protein SAMN05444006_109117 [Allgaiera indica]